MHDSLKITRPGGRWILLRGALTAPLLWAAVCATPLIYTITEAIGRDALCRRCADAAFKFDVDGFNLMWGDAAIAIGFVLGCAVQVAAAVKFHREGRSEQTAGSNAAKRGSAPWFFAAAFALVMLAVAYFAALLMFIQPIRFYLTAMISGYSLALLPSFVIAFVAPAFRPEPKLEAAFTHARSDQTEEPHA